MWDKKNSCRHQDTKVSEGGGCRQVRNKGVKLSLGSRQWIFRKGVCIFFFFLTHCPTPFFIGYKLIFHKLSLFCIWWQPISNLFFILSSLTNKLFLFLQSRRKRVSSSGSTSQPAMAKPSGQRPVILIRLTRNCGLEQELKLSFSDGISVGLRKNLVSNSYRCK